MKTKILIKTEYIKLCQLLKLAGVIGNGSEAKEYIESNNIYVNGELEKRRGRKIYAGYVVKTDDWELNTENNVEN